jgi:hypothetical protein
MTMTEGTISVDTESVIRREKTAMSLEKELATYNSHLLELLPYEGRYVLVCEDRIDGTFDTYEQGLAAGYEKYGLDPFMVKQINQAEPIHYFSRDLSACRS